MDLLQTLLLALASGPFAGICVVLLVRLFGGPAVTARRLLLGSICGGVVFALPLALALLIAPEPGAGLYYAALSLPAGAACGLLVGAVACFVFQGIKLD